MSTGGSVNQDKTSEKNSEGSESEKYENWRDGVCIKQFGTSSPREKILWSEKECEDWSDSEPEDIFGDIFFDNSSLDETLSEQCSEPGEENWAPTGEDWELELFSGPNFEPQSLEDLELHLDSIQQMAYSQSSTHDSRTGKLKQGSGTGKLEQSSYIGATNGELEQGSVSGTIDFEESPCPNLEEELDSENTVKYNDLDSFILGASGDRPKSQDGETSSWEDITICQLRSSSMLRVSVILQDLGKGRPYALPTLLKPVISCALEKLIKSKILFCSGVFI